MRIFFSLLATVVAATALVSASGAGGLKAAKGTTIDVSTRAAVVKYLRTIHVDAKGVVIQRGSRNYAGAHCPGTAWTCANTRHTVVQIAKSGGQNRFVCTSAHCAVVQISGVSGGSFSTGRQLASASAPKPPPAPNNASCIKTTGVTQSCSISQLGGSTSTGSNTAIVVEGQVGGAKVSGLTQTPLATAQITQSTGSGNNLACVLQQINVEGNTVAKKGMPVTVTLQAHQSVSVVQDSRSGNNAVRAATPSGSCGGLTSPLTQSQTLTSIATGTAAITQKENDVYSPCGDGVTGDYANLCLDIEQNQGSAKGSATGSNDATFTQTSSQTAIANTLAGPVTQTQSTPFCSTPEAPTNAPADCVFPGGLVGTVNQYSTGVSTASATQTETQCEDAAKSGLTQCHTGLGDEDFDGTYTLTQNQYGPVGVGNVRHNHRGRQLLAFGKGLGTSVQSGGNVNNSFTISQISTQDNDRGTGSNQQNSGQADCTSPTGSCTATQTTTVNNTPTQDGYTSPTISNLTIKCPKSEPCVPTPPPAPEITGTPGDPSESTSPTFTWTEAATGGVTLKCSIDGGTTFTTCDSPTSYSNLSLGSHTFVVKAVDTYHNESGTDSFTWTIVPYLTFEATDDDASASWSGTPGASPIRLIVGSEAGTYAQFTLHNFEGIAIGDLPAEPTFATDTFSGGAPRYEIDLDNGDYLFGYPSNAPYGRSWDVICGHDGCTPMAQVPWGDVTTAEGTAKVTDVLVEADFPAGVSATYNISAFSFDGYALSFFGDHFH